jgi:hypothetical protein
MQMRTALELYSQDHNGNYPTNLDSSGTETTAYVGTSANCSGFTGSAVVANGLAPSYISKIPEDPKPSGANCYMYASDGVDYKFLIFETVEFNTQTPRQHPYADPRLSSGCAATPSGTRIRTKSLSVYTTNVAASKVDTCW